MSEKPDFYTSTGKPSKVKHGDYYAYTTIGCRCERCTKANADYMKRYRDYRKSNAALAARMMQA